MAARQCRLKVAQYLAEKQEYTRAIKIYEQAAKDAMDSRSGPYACKEHFLKAGLCYLAHDDAVGLRQALDKYKDMLPTFDRDRECKFLTDLMEACDNYDADQFTNVVSQYNSLSTLDSWKVGLLAKVKEHIKKGEGEGHGDDDDEDGGLV